MGLVLLALCAGQAARADEYTATAEKLRAPARQAFRDARDIERAALAKRDAINAKIGALLDMSGREFADVSAELVRTENRIAALRQDLIAAERELQRARVAAKDRLDDPDLLAAQAKLAGLKDQLSRTEAARELLKARQIAKAPLPNPVDLYIALIRADLEIDAARSGVLAALSRYLAVLQPKLPVYLQSVAVYSGTADAIYRAEWRVDGEAADAAERDWRERIVRMIADLRDGLSQIDQARKEAAEARLGMALVMKPMGERLQAIGQEIGDAEFMKTAIPALIEIAGVIGELALSGGTATITRYSSELSLQAAEKGVEAMTVLGKSKQAGAVLTAAEQALLDKLREEALHKSVEKGLEGANAGGNKILVEILDFKAKRDQTSGASETIQDMRDVIVSDALEQVFQRAIRFTAVGGKALYQGAAERGGQLIANWRGIANGARAVGVRGATWPELKKALVGNSKSNLLAVGVTAAKAAVTAYYANKLNNLQIEWTEIMGEMAMRHMLYRNALVFDATLLALEREYTRMLTELRGYAMLTMGPRKLVVMLEKPLPTRELELSFELKFSDALDKPPIVKIAGLVVEMRAIDGEPGKGATRWRGVLSPKKLPDIDQALIDVSLADGSAPYPSLDANPATPTRFVLPDALDQAIPVDRQEWADFERGPDRNHRITLRPIKQQDVPWRGQNRCDQIDCDCAGAAEREREACAKIEANLRRECAARGQTYGQCPPPPYAGPRAFPKSLLPPVAGPGNAPPVAPIPAPGR